MLSSACSMDTQRIADKAKNDFNDFMTVYLSLFTISGTTRNRVVHI